MLSKGSLTILFEDPFWIGLYERIHNDKYEVCKITFGAEPKDYEVSDFLLKNWHKLKFSPPVQINHVEKQKVSPKRMQREIHKQVQNTGISTKSQQALQLQREQMKTERKTINKEQREAEQERRFKQKQQKRREKHRGH